MDLGLIVGLAALVVGIVAAFVAIVTYRKQYPRREVQVSRDATSLLTRGADVTGVKVYVGADLMDQPYVVDVSIRASGRADVAPRAFDGPIAVKLGVPIRKDLTPSTTRYPLIALSGTEVGLQPVLLKSGSKGVAYEGRYLCEGRPSFEPITQSLEGITIKEGATRDFQKRSGILASNPALLQAGGTIIAALIGVMAVLVATMIASGSLTSDISDLGQKGSISPSAPPQTP